MAKVNATMSTEIALDTLKASESLRKLEQIVKTTTNAWKAHEAQLKSAGDAVGASEAKYQGLGNAIEAQKAKIEAIKQKQSELNNELKDGEKMTQAQANAYLKYENDLNRATTKLASLEQQQQKAKTAMDYQKSGLAGLKEEYKRAESSSKAYVERLEAEGKHASAAAEKQKALKASLGNLREQYNKQAELLSKVKERSGETSEAYLKQKEYLDKTATSIAKTQNEYKELSRSMGVLQPTGIKNLDTAILSVKDNAGKAKSKVKDMFERSKALAVGAATAVAGFGAVLVSGAQEASELQKVYVENTNLAVTGGEKVKDVTKAIAEMQKEGKKYSMEYGESQKTIADGYQELIKRGYTTEQALGSMGSILKAAKASGDSFDDTMKVTTSTLEAFGMKADTTSEQIKNTSKVANSLAMAADATSSSFESIGYGMTYAGSTAKAAGISLDNTATALGVLSNNGLEAEKAGTGLQRIISRLISPTDEAAKALQSYGLTVDDFKDKSGKLLPIEDIFKKINKAVPDSQRLQLFNTVFGQTGQNAATILSDNLKTFDEVQKKVKGAYDNDYVSKLANKNMKATKNATAQAKESFEAVKIDLGTQLMPAISDASKALAGFLNSKDGQKLVDGVGKAVKTVADGILDLGKWAANHTGTIKTFGTVLAGVFVTSKILKFTKGISKAVKAYREAKTATEGVTAAQAALNVVMDANPVGAIVLAITAVVAGLVLAYKKIKPFRNLVNGIGKWAGKAFDGVKKAIGEAGKFIKKNWKTIKPALLAPFTPLILTVKASFEAIKAIIKAGAKVIKGIGKFFKNPLKAIKDFGKDAKKIMSKTWNNLKKGASDGLKKVTNTAKSNLKKTKKVFSSAWSSVKKGASSMWKKLKSGSTGGTSKMTSATKKGLNKLKKAFSKAWDNIKKGAKKLWDKLKDHAKKGTDKVKKEVEKGNKKTKQSHDKHNKDVEKANKKHHDKMAKQAKDGASRSAKNTKKEQAKDKKNQNKHWKDLEKGLKKSWSSMSKQAKSGASKLGKNIKKQNDKTKKSWDKTWSSMKKGVKNLWNKVTKSSKSDSKKLGKEISGISKYWKTAERDSTKSIKKMIKQIDDFSKKKVGNEFKKSIAEAMDKVQDDWEDTWKDIEATLEKTWNRIFAATRKQFSNNFKNEIFKTLDDLKAKFNQILDQSSKGYNNFWNNMKRLTGSGMNGIISIINQGVSGINSLVGSFGGNKNAIGQIGTVKYATGTGLFSNQRRAITSPTMALLNDGDDSPETGNVETVILPNGTMFQPRGRNVETFLPAGSEVLNATESRILGLTKRFATGTGFFSDLFSQAQKMSVPAFNSSSDEGKEKMADYIGEAAEKSKEKFSQIFNPLVDKFGGFFNQFQNAIDKPVDTEGLNWFSALFKMAQEKLGSINAKAGMLGDDYQFKQMGADAGADPWGYFYKECVSFVASRLANLGVNPSLFSHLGNGNQWLSASVPHGNAKPGTVAVYSHGGQNHVSYVTAVHGGTFDGEEYNWLGQHSYHQYFNRPISQADTFLDFGVKVKTKEEESAEVDKNLTGRQQLAKKQTDPMMKWIEDNLADFGGGGSADNPGGTGVDRWTPYVKRALKANGIDPTDFRVQKILATIRRESNGDPNVQNNWDSNAAAGHPSIGLMQTIGPTFEAYKHKGHNNIRNGYDNLLAAINYIKNRYGTSDAAFERVAAYGYRNGGIVSKPGIYPLAEDGIPEYVIPTDKAKRGRAWKLLSSAVSHFAGEESADNHDNSTLAKLEAKFDAVLDLLSVIASNSDKDINVHAVVDGQSLANGMVRYNDKAKTRYDRRQALLKGKLI